jgi:oxygen-independent coproporphyrinogen-3 oxidase
MLGLRLAEGLPVTALSAGASARVEENVARGLLDQTALADGRLALTPAGRLLADAVIRDLVD